MLARIAVVIALKELAVKAPFELPPPREMKVVPCRRGSTAALSDRALVTLVHPLKAMLRVVLDGPAGTPDQVHIQYPISIVGGFGGSTVGMVTVGTEEGVLDIGIKVGIWETGADDGCLLITGAYVAGAVQNVRLA